MKIKEVAEYIGVTRKHVYTLLKQGKIKSHKVKGLNTRNHNMKTVVIYKDDVDDYMRTNGRADRAMCAHLSHTAGGRCRGCGEQHQILYVPLGKVAHIHTGSPDREFHVGRIAMQQYADWTNQAQDIGGAWAEIERAIQEK